MFVSDILRVKGSAIHTGTPDMTVSEAANQMTGRQIGSLLILGGDENASIVGILSERDIVRGLATFGVDCLNGPVSQLMTQGVTTIG
ncbi:MAG: CBS domain-containing protein, partial [Rhodospirillaceae bacterium]|nr:CBS domain-containing protein [Rhodospirillaceae bacterium]